MKYITLTIALLVTIIILCSNIGIDNEIIKVDADSIVTNIDKYKGGKVETEGIIIHICGVDGRKMKLKTQSGAIIKIVSKDSLSSFNKEFFKKRIKVQGIVKEYRIEKEYIEQMENNKTLLCHIDNTPCKDSIWVNNLIKSGKSDSISQKDIDRLNLKLLQSGKSYISVICIIADKVEIIE